ncbi:uncharacterized protein LOC130140508 [Syzygium oleosum]|uniref:uncharacterized protein LOC130140508 n=1 Tax=Syzygium oleosum TaxID=219896 RepID=UPI0024BB0495|nr:uncharacterized protein LOC130140508 [Syzygium oleosum]
MEQRSFPNGNCRQCGRQHGNVPCPMLKRCFGCGQLGHVVKDCPQGRPQPSAPPVRQQQQPTQGGAPPPRNLQRPPMQGKVYAITQKEAEASKTVISGTLSLCDQLAYALFDTGATHSFVSARFMRLVGLKSELLEVPLSVSTPLKDMILSTLACKDCKISIGGVDQRIDLVVLVMYDFDVIIGMDWLSKQWANADCYEKVIQFNPPNHPSFEFVGNGMNSSLPLISALEAHRLLNNGY